MLKIEPRIKLWMYYLNTFCLNFNNILNINSSNNDHLKRIHLGKRCYPHHCRRTFRHVAPKPRNRKLEVCCQKHHDRQRSRLGQQTRPIQPRRKLWWIQNWLLRLCFNVLGARQARIDYLHHAHRCLQHWKGSTSSRWCLELWFQTHCLVRWMGWWS